MGEHGSGRWRAGQLVGAWNQELGIKNQGDGVRGSIGKGGVWSGMAPNRGEYAILLEAPDKLLDSSTPIIEAGQTVTLVIGLDDNIKIGRDGQVKITTNHGAVFLGTAKIGDQKS